MAALIEAIAVQLLCHVYSFGVLYLGILIDSSKLARILQDCWLYGQCREGCCRGHVLSPRFKKFAIQICLLFGGVASLMLLHCQQLHVLPGITKPLLHIFNTNGHNQHVSMNLHKDYELQNVDRRYSTRPRQLAFLTSKL